MKDHERGNLDDETQNNIPNDNTPLKLHKRNLSVKDEL